MKKIFIALALVAGWSFMSCDPVEDSFSAPKSVTEAEFDVTAKTMLQTVDGEEYAVGVVENHSPIPSWIEYLVPDFGVTDINSEEATLISGIKNGCSLILRTEGANTFRVHGINPDGSEVVKIVTCDCPAGKRKKVLPSLENIVWEPILTKEDGTPWYPQIKDWDTSEARFSDAEGIMGKWTKVDYDAKMKDKNVFIEFDKPWTGNMVVMTGWWTSQQAPLVGDGKSTTYKVYMDPGLIEDCYEKDFAIRGDGGISGQDVHIVKMYTLLEL